MKLKYIITAIVALMAAGNQLYGQPAAIPWSVADGGGGKSSGGGLTLASSVGQPAIGVVTGTGFIVEGGFLPGLRQLSGSTSTLNVQLASAWNLLSVPFIAADMRKTTLFPTAVSSAFAYSPTGYVSKDTLLNGAGYWLKFPSAQAVQFTGTSFAPETINVSNGWNMIGTISYPALTSSIIALPSASVLGPYFGYAVSGYSAEDTLKPGMGYWVKISGTGKLVISAAPSIPPQVSSTIVPVKNEHASGSSVSSAANLLEGFHILQVRDAREQERTVYFTGKHRSINLGQFELPPIPPGENLDVRFRSQRTVEMPEAEGLPEYPLQISNAAFPLTFRWDLGGDDGGSYTLEVRTEKGSTQYPLRGTGNLVVADEGFVSAKLRLIAQQEVQLPKAFALYQNFPNPFNPTTTIKYDVPRTAKVSLKLYDLLGQEVRTLVSEERAAGRYAVELNANDLPSGVYYFRLLAGDFSDVKRLLLLK